MPLYEMIVISRPGTARVTKNIIQHVKQGASEFKINLRNVEILGDRVMSSVIRTPKMEILSVGRYLQFLLDSAPNKL